MLEYLFLIPYSLFFLYLAWKNLNWALYLFFFLLPTYLIRFNIGPLPTTLLEVMLGIITIIWLIKFHSKIISQLRSLIIDHQLLSTAISLFILSATISIFTSTDTLSALGEWKAFYIEPIIVFLILVTSYKLSSQMDTLRAQVTKNFINNLVFALILSGLITSALAIYQHFTGWLVPYDFWANNNTFRVTAWYGFPNAVGLFLAPLIPLALYGLKQSIVDFKNKDWKKYLFFILYSLFFILSPLAIIYSKGTGPLIGVIAGIGLLLLFYKKTRWVTLVVSLVGIVSLVSLPQLSGLKNEILLQDRSGQIRLSIWNETWEFLKDNPITGAGLASYEDKIKPYHTTLNGEGIEIFHHPHNIFLTMWVNLGLLGLVGFVLILAWIIKQSLSKNNGPMKQRNNGTIFIFASMSIIIITGLVDSPYIKNDLSILFWLLPALLIISNTQSQSVKSIN